MSTEQINTDTAAAITATQEAERSVRSLAAMARRLQNELDQARRTIEATPTDITDAKAALAAMGDKLAALVDVDDHPTSVTNDHHRTIVSMHANGFGTVKHELIGSAGDEDIMRLLDRFNTRLRKLTGYRFGRDTFTTTRSRQGDGGWTKPDSLASHFIVTMENKTVGSGLDDPPTNGVQIQVMQDVTNERLTITDVWTFGGVATATAVTNSQAELMSKCLKDSVKKWAANQVERDQRQRKEADYNQALADGMEAAANMANSVASEVGIKSALKRSVLTAIMACHQACRRSDRVMNMDPRDIAMAIKRNPVMDGSGYAFTDTALCWPNEDQVKKHCADLIDAGLVRGQFYNGGNYNVRQFTGAVLDIADVKMVRASRLTMKNVSHRYCYAAQRYSGTNAGCIIVGNYKGYGNTGRTDLYVIPTSGDDSVNEAMNKLAALADSTTDEAARICEQLLNVGTCFAVVRSGSYCPDSQQGWLDAVARHGAVMAATL